MKKCNTSKIKTTCTQQAFYPTLVMHVAKEMDYANMPLGKTATKIHLMKQAGFGMHGAKHLKYSHNLRMKFPNPCKS